MELTKRIVYIRLALGIVLGAYLGTLAFIFGYLLWQSLTLHLADPTAQMVTLVVIALLATAWGGFVACWFNYYRIGWLVGIFVGIGLYLMASLLTSTGPESFGVLLPFTRTAGDVAELQAILPPVVAGAVGGTFAELMHRGR